MEISLLKHPSEQNDGMNTDLMLDDEVEQQIHEDDNHIRCAQCLHAITRREERIIIDGAHRHTFANPHGLIFEIGCFRNAEGSRYMGSPTGEFTWFKGYAWRISLCGKCFLHLGWLYTAAGKDSFFGLITDRLVYQK